MNPKGIIEDIESMVRSAMSCGRSPSDESLRSLYNDIDRCENSRVAELKKQLPETMQNCTILFKECEKGHGRLTATNWHDHGCQTCEVESLRKRLEPTDITKAYYDV